MTRQTESPAEVQGRPDRASAGQHAGRSTSSYREAMVRLRSSQKTAKGAPAYSRFINRRIGRHLAALAYKWSLTPNQVTIISAVCTFAAIASVALAKPSVVVGIIVAALLVLGYALDSADGQLARLRGGGSPAGEWLDHMVDSVKTSTIHLAVLICAYRYFDLRTTTPLLIPLSFAAVATVWFFAVLLTDQLRRAHAAATSTAVASASSAAPVWRSLVVLPTDYGVLCLVFVALGWHSLFLGLYALLLIGSVLFLMAALPAWYREMKSFSAATPGAGTHAP